MSYDTKEARLRCEQVIEDAFARAETLYGMTFRRPTVLWRNMGGCAGLACYGPWELHLSPHALATEGDRFIERTPVHEVAHFVAFVVWKEAGHSSYWRAVLASLGGKDLGRCHDFAMADAPRESKKRARYLRALDNL